MGGRAQVREESRAFRFAGIEPAKVEEGYRTVGFAGAHPYRILEVENSKLQVIRKASFMATPRRMAAASRMKRRCDALVVSTTGCQFGERGAQFLQARRFAE